MPYLEFGKCNLERHPKLSVKFGTVLYIKNNRHILFEEKRIALR
jgi:hypothetical protein